MVVQAQSQIKQRLSDPEAIAVIGQLLAREDITRRTTLARGVCEHFDFRDGRGCTQTAGCLKALSELAAAGHFELPAARSRPRAGLPRRLPVPVAAAREVPDKVGDVQGLELVLVEDDAHLRVWNELMIREHPRGAGPLVGAQLRYLIGSAHGWLGGLSFSAAALQLRDRDAWIGWDAATRKAQLHRVVGLSRLLLRSRGCRNLASWTLGRVLRRVAEDFAARFGYRPWLVESFVDPARFDGGCYRAANWVQVGSTQGRGRQDSSHRQDAGIKAIYVYPLVCDFRARLGLAEPVLPGPLAPGEGLDGAGWARQEFGGARLGDARLGERLVMSVERAAEQPGRAFTGVAKGDWAATKGYYRLIDQPADSAVTMAAILEPHQRRTRQRMQGQARVLCIADGTELDYSGLAECQGLGVIGSNQTGAQSHGLHLHSTLAVSADGVPLGIVDARCRVNDPEAPPNKPKTPIEKKNSYDWVLGLRACMAQAAHMPDTEITCVMDREADFYELLKAQREQPCVELLIRAQYNRRTTGGTRLFDLLRESPPRGQLRLNVKRQSARPKRSKQKARAGRVTREALLDLHFERVEFPPPPYHKDKAPVTLSAVHVVESAPPEGVQRLEWFLLTTRRIESVADAEQCLKDYALRWRIEDWHRVLKSGCRIEQLAHRRVERLERALAINLVIGWRIMLMTLLGREVPELPAEVLFSDLEIEVLQAYAKAHRLTPPTLLGEAVLLVARLGGYLGRKHDPPPGHQLMWYGYQDLTFMCKGYALRTT